MGLLKGTLDVPVLKALSWGPMHGFEITAAGLLASWIPARRATRVDPTEALRYD